MTWINGYRVWLSESQSLQNAQKVVDFLYTNDKDWSKESISALIGNMRHESSVNPNMYEYGYEWSEDRGFGLVQWTPRSKYWNWALQNGYNESDLRNGDAQLARIDYEVENNIQWIAVSKINNLTFKEFRTNSRGLSLNVLTEAFTWGYERPNAQAGEESMPDRKAFANRAFNELDWSGGGNPPDPEDPVDPPDPPKEIDYTKFIEELNELIKKMIGSDVFKMGLSGLFKNNYLTLIKQLDNSFKIKTNKPFLDKINEKLNELKDLQPVEPVDPDPVDPDPVDNKPVYPTLSHLPITSEYGYRGDIGVPGASHYHWAIDIGSGGSTTNPIYATQDGIVRNAGTYNNGGIYVIIEHTKDNYWTRYLHLKSYNVTVGQTVTKGQTIGIMGNTGIGSGIHLDFAVSKNGTFQTETDTISPRVYLGIE